MSQDNSAQKLPSQEQETRLKSLRGVAAFTSHRFAFGIKKSKGGGGKKGGLSPEKKRERILLGLFVLLGLLYLMFFTNLIISPEEPMAALPPEKQAMYDELIKQATKNQDPTKPVVPAPPK